MSDWGAFEPTNTAATKASSSTPPNSLEAERSVLGGVLLENSALDAIADINLTADDFYKEGHQHIFRAIFQLITKGEPADTVTVSETLRNSNLLTKTGGLDYLTGLIEYEFSAANVPNYAKIVKAKSVLRNFIKTSTSLVTEAYEGVESQEDFLDKAESEIFKVTNQKGNTTFDPLKTILLRNFQQIEEVAAKQGEVSGITTGFYDLDRKTTGWQPGQLIIIAARPGMGKTSFMLNLILNAALEGKKNAAFFSMEMSKEELCMRLLASEAQVDSHRLKTGRLQEEDWKKLQRTAGRLAECGLFFDDTPALNVLEVRSRCRRIQSLHGLDLVVVDYLQLMRGLSRGGQMNREQEISEISRGLKALAKELKVPIIAASQLNRGVEMRNDKRPMLSDLRESGAIEQDADMVMFIYRDEQYNKDSSESKGLAEIIIAKHRAGSTGTINLEWIGQYTTFLNITGNDNNNPPPEQY